MSAIHEPSKMALRFSSSQDSSMTRRVLCFSFFRLRVVGRKKVVFVFLLTKKMTRKAKRKKRKKRSRKASGKQVDFSSLLPPPPRALSLVRRSLAALASFFVLSLSLSRARDSRRFFSLSLSLSFACVSPHACFACVFLKKEKISIF